MSASSDPISPLRLTTDASLTAILQETPFYLADSVTLILGRTSCPRFRDRGGGAIFRGEETAQYWREWARVLSIPFRMAGGGDPLCHHPKAQCPRRYRAIIAAMTTSVPESAGSTRNWDYRYRWLRDGLRGQCPNRLGRPGTMDATWATSSMPPSAGNSSLAAGLWHRWASRFGRAGGVPGRIPGHGTGAHRQSGLPAGPTRRLMALRSPPRHMYSSINGSPIGATKPFRRLEPLGEQAIPCFDQPRCRFSGSAAARGPYLFGGHVLGGLRPSGAHRRTAWIARRATYWQAGGPPAPVISRRAWNTHRKCFCLHLRRRCHGRKASCFWPNWVFLAADDPRFEETVMP